MQLFAALAMTSYVCIAQPVGASYHRLGFGNELTASHHRFRQTSNMKKFISIALTNPAEGREADYNAWYEEQHVFDVLAIPGIQSAQRFRLSEKSRQQLGYRYMALYEIESDNIENIHQAIAERAGTDAMPRSDAVGTDRLFLDYEVISPRITAEEASVKRSRK